MNKCIVIGGGFAGLTTAAYLVNKNIKVVLLESSPKLGGRAYSFLSKDGTTVIDNGQHILMGCYYETLRFMKLIAAKDNLIQQSKLEINLLKEEFELIKLKAYSLPYPFNLLFGILNYKAVGFADRLKILKFFFKIFSYSENELKKITVEEWLRKEKQNSQISKALWEVIAVGALNTSIKKASAKIFSDVLKEIFIKERSGSTIILPKYDLTKTYCEKAQAFIERAGGIIYTSCPVINLKIENEKIVMVETDKEKINDFDCVVAAVPFYSLKKIIPVAYLNRKPELRYSAILSVHIWLKRNPLKEKFYGLINSPLHWIFNKKTHLTLVISDADYLVNKTKEEIFDIISGELKKFTGISEDNIVDYQVIKEKRATFVPAENTIDSRPSVTTALENFFVAGDWIDTNLPSTIESAVKSGRMASDAILHAKSCKFNYYHKRKISNVGKS